PWQSRWNGVEDLDHDGARVAYDAAARPKQARVEGHRHAGQGEPLVERHEARLVVGRSARRPARALGKDHDLASLAGATPRVADEALQRAGALVALDEDVLELVGEPAVERDP